MTDHDCQYTDDAAAWVLDALDAEQATRFEAHLHQCAECRSRVAELQPAAQILALGVEQIEPPAALGDRIMAVVNAEAELLRAAGPEADRVRPAKRRRGRLFGLSPTLAGGLACVLLAIGVAGGIVLGGGGSGASSTTFVAQGPQGMNAQATVKDDHVTLHFDGMKPPPDGRVYQVWLMRDGKVVPSKALFTVGPDGEATVQVPEQLDGAGRVLVSDEPQGGSTTPTSTPSVEVGIT